jgi:hypothetical protein
MDRRNFMKFFAISPVAGPAAVRNQVSLLEKQIPSILSSVGDNECTPKEAVCTGNSTSIWRKQGLRGLFNRFKNDKKVRRLTALMVQERAEENVRYRQAITPIPVLKGAPSWLIRKKHIEAEARHLMNLYTDRLEEHDLMDSLINKEDTDSYDIKYDIKKVICAPWRY